MGTAAYIRPRRSMACGKDWAAAENIRAAVNGGVPKPFRFSTIGQLASIGHHTGAAQVLGMRFSGFVASCLWRSVYLAKLPGIQQGAGNNSMDPGPAVLSADRTISYAKGY
jgi:NADH dehydrogenase